MPGRGVSLPTRVYLLVCGLCIGLIVYCGVTYTTIRDVNLGGRYYQKIEKNRELIADVHSPSNHIVESYLLTLHMANEVEQPAGALEIQALVSELQKLKRSFSKQHDIRMRTLPNDAVKRIVTAECYGAAVRFYEVACDQFIPACYAGDVETVKNLVRHDLRVHYDVYRAATEKVALLALDRQDTLEKQVSALVGQRTTQSFLFAFIISCCLAAFGIWFARSIVSALKKSAIDLQADACVDIQRISQQSMEDSSAVEAVPSDDQAPPPTVAATSDVVSDVKKPKLDFLKFTNDRNTDSTAAATGGSSWFAATNHPDPKRN